MKTQKNACKNAKKPAILAEKGKKQKEEVDKNVEMKNCMQKREKCTQKCRNCIQKRGKLCIFSQKGKGRGRKERIKERIEEERKE